MPAEEEKNKSCPSLPGTSLALSLTSTPFPPRPLFQKKKKKKQSLTYVVRNEAKRSQKLTLLHGVTGALLPGQLSALMGPSGSSKTTLLDVLAGRKTVGDISGTLRFAGHPASRTFLRRYTGYVEQFDTLLANLTVAEMLMYTAELKNPLATPAATKVARVNAVIEQLALAPCRDVRIGSSLARGISGGQAKRVNIGIALVTSPRVLFLDEPTSGLDSFTANEVMTVVKGLVKTGITICATIHSPTPYCFNLFDRLMILLRGKVVYAGENGHAAVEYFERAFPEVPRFSANGRTTGKGGEPADPNSSTTVFHNRAEWIVDVTTKADRDGLGGSFADAYAASELAAANAAAVACMLSERVPVSATVAAELATRSGTTTPAWWGVRTLLKYRMARDYRDASFLGPRIADKAVLSLIIMSLYWRVGADHSQSNVNNLTAVLFLWAIMPGYTASAYVPALVLERSLFVRERADGLYRPVTYLLSKMIEELVIAFFNTLVFGAVVFFPCKLAGSFPHFWAVYFTTTATGIALGYAIASAAPNMDVANAALPAYVTTLLFFVGLLLRPQDQPKYWRWYSYIDFLKYAWQAQMVNQFEGEQTLRALDGGSILDFYSIGDANKWEQVRCVFCSPFVSSREGKKTEKEKKRGKKTHTKKTWKLSKNKINRWPTSRSSSGRLPFWRGPAWRSRGTRRGRWDRGGGREAGEETRREREKEKGESCGLFSSRGVLSFFSVFPPEPGRFSPFSSSKFSNVGEREIYTGRGRERERMYHGGDGERERERASLVFLRNGEKDETCSCKKRELALLFFLRFFDALSLLLRPRAALDYKNQKTSFYTCCCCFAPFPSFYLAKTQNQKPFKEKTKKEVRGGKFSTRGRFFLPPLRPLSHYFPSFPILGGLSLSLSLGVEKRSCSALCFPSALSLSRETIDLERVPSSNPPSPRWRPVSVENRNDGDLEAAISPSLFFIAPLRKKAKRGPIDVAGCCRALLLEIAIPR